MPSPLAHVVAGLAVSQASERILHGSARSPAAASARASERSRRVALWCSGLALLPDIDFLVGAHRMYTHSLGAILAIVAAATVLAIRREMARPLTIGLICGAAYGSHILLDWLGADRSLTPGLMALWPVSSSHVLSGLDIFLSPSWSYWDPADFVVGNLRYLVRELIVIFPFVVVMQYLRTNRRTRRAQLSESPTQP